MLIFPSRDTHMHQSYNYAAQNWPYHCQQSGFWHENPQILEEISKTLDACKLRKIQIIRPDPYQVANFIKWLPVWAQSQLNILYSKLTQILGRYVSPSGY